MTHTTLACSTIAKRHYFNRRGYNKTQIGQNELYKANIQLNTNVPDINQTLNIKVTMKLTFIHQLLNEIYS